MTIPPIIPINYDEDNLSHKVNKYENKHNYKLYRKSSLNHKHNIYESMNLTKELDDLA